MKVLLIRPPAVEYRKEPGLILSEPLGLMYLASYIKQHKSNIEVSLIDGFAGDIKLKEGDFCGTGVSYQELKNKIASLMPDILGINCTFTQYAKGAHDLARIAKEISPDIFVVFGGSHASAFYQQVLSDLNVDLVVKGEGEQTFLEIIDHWEKKESLKGIAGTVTRCDRGIKINPPRPFIKDLDQLPFPARDLVDMSKYCDNDYAVQKSMRYPRFSMVTSRGCPFRCVFCSIHSVWCHSYRSRSPKSVVDEVELLYRAYGAREIMFYDDNITLDKERMGAICDELIARKIDIKWSPAGGVAIWTMDKETLLKMKRSGCYKITFGLESGSRATLRFIHKEFLDFAQAKELIRYCNKIGLWTISSFIIGFPYETREDVEKTLAFALDSDLDMASFYAATPYPGTELYDICKQDGLLPELSLDSSLEWIGEIGEATCDMHYLKKEEINFLFQNLKKRFTKKRIVNFLNPLRLLRKLKGLDEIKYFLKMVKNYLPFIKSSLEIRVSR
ncbi:radical SAM protein [bacterium]|nr:MAG: radical SAM protein [bacterium]